MSGDIIQFISSVGFPIVACIYMARVMRAEIQALTKAVGDMSEAIDNLNERLDRLEERFNE